MWVSEVPETRSRDSWICERWCRYTLNGRVVNFVIDRQTYMSRLCYANCSEKVILWASQWSWQHEKTDGISLSCTDDWRIKKGLSAHSARLMGRKDWVKVEECLLSDHKTLHLNVYYIMYQLTLLSLHIHKALAVDPSSVLLLCCPSLLLKVLRLGYCPPYS